MNTTSNTQQHDSRHTPSAEPHAEANAPSSTHRRKRLTRLAGIVGSAGVVAAMGAGLSACGSTGTQTISNAAATSPAPVSVVVTSPTSGSVVAANSVIVRGTVDPPTAEVEVQGKPAAVGDGIFTGTATLHAGKTTIDIIGSAPGAVPGSTSVAVVEQAGNGGGSTHAAPTTIPSATPGIASEQPDESPSDETACGGGLAVGPDTTCAFAENVRMSYENEGPGTYEVYSPVTRMTYTMSCSYGTPVVCTGGNDASVYFQ